MVRVIAVMAGLATALPAIAGEMSASEARANTLRHHASWYLAC